MGRGDRSTATLGVIGALALLSACGPAPALPVGERGLRSLARPADGGQPSFDEGRVIGAISVTAGGCGGQRVELTLAGPSFSTAGPVEAELLEPEDDEPEGVRWLRFPMRWPVGAGEGLLRVEGARARLPLGLRPGEHDLQLMLTDAPPAAEALAVAEASASAALAEGAAAWAAGRFSLVDAEGRLVGDLDFFDDSGVMVALYDESWTTTFARVAARADEGGEILLTVPVEPSLEGESALLMVNLAEGVVVVPSAPAPQPEDRWLRLRPGGPSEADRDAAFVRAANEAEAAERAWLGEWGPRLAADAWSPVGCRPATALGEAWDMMLRGYAITVLANEAGGCDVQLDPQPPQHRRTLRALARADGLQWVAPAAGR